MLGRRTIRFSLDFCKLRFSETDEWKGSLLVSESIYAAVCGHCKISQPFPDRVECIFLKKKKGGRDCMVDFEAKWLRLRLAVTS